ncbi:342_t:CDS:2, partial [Dentiscutata heterogama]
ELKSLQVWTKQLVEPNNERQEKIENKGTTELSSTYCWRIQTNDGCDKLRAKKN